MSSGNTSDRRKVEFTDVVGTFGKWQLMICVHVWIAVTINGMNNFVIIFQAPNVDHWCSVPDEITSNMTSENWISNGVPRDLDESLLSKCHRFETWNVTEANRTVVKCNQWTYDTSEYHSTIVSKFNLVCGREWMIPLLKSAYMCGYMGAGILSGFSDRFGRRPLLLGSITLFLLSAFMTTFSSSFVMMLVLRFLLSLGISTCTNVSFVLQTEVVGAKERVILNYVRSTMWTVGMLLLVVIAYFIRDWFWLQVAVTIPGVLLAASMWWFIPESPRFLLTRGDVDRSAKLLKTASHWNGMNIKNDEAVMYSLLNGIQKDESEKESSHASWLDLFRTPEIRKRTLLLYFVWFVVIFVYYGISYNINRLHGDIYVNFAVSSAVEIPFLLVFLVVSHYFGRRKALAVAATLCGCTLFTTFLAPKQYPLLTTALLLAGKAFLRATLCDIYMYTAEIFPTVLRSIGLGSSSTFSRFGGIAAPFAWGSLGGEHVPRILFGVLATVAGFVIFTLPETKNKNVSDTIKEARNFGRQQQPEKDYKELETKKNPMIV